MRAVGFRKRALQRLLLDEHLLLLALGLGTGLLAALIAVVPALLSPAAHVPWLLLAGVAVGLWLGGLVWVYLAVALALRGPVLPSLRGE